MQSLYGGVYSEKTKDLEKGGTKMSEDEMLKFRISETEKKLEIFDARMQKMNEQIGGIKTDIAETNAYVKQIYDELHSGRTLNGHYFKTGKMWAGLVAEMIRALIIISGIIAGIKLAV